jgi:hypothetical protein
MSWGVPEPKEIMDEGDSDRSIFVTPFAGGAEAE